MSKQSKNYSQKHLGLDEDDKETHHVNFNIEEDAEDIFKSYLEFTQPISKDVDQQVFADSSYKSATKKAKTEAIHCLDLHGMSVDEAIYAVDSKISELVKIKKNMIPLKIITGKGLHSGEQGGVLMKAIHEHVRKHHRKKIIRLESSPAKTIINGMPFRGHFTVYLSGK